MQFLFSVYALDVARRELRRGGKVVPIEPQVFDLLSYLVANSHRVVSKDDLIAHVWGGRIVSESTITTRIFAARKAIDDLDRSERFIRTLARKGIRFVAEVTEQSATSEVQMPPTRVEVVSRTDAPTSDEAPRSRRASIAVMPFANSSAIRGPGGGTTDALVHDIITRLAKLRSLFVIAQGTVFALQERGVQPDEAARLLGVDYLVCGTARTGGGRITLTVELIAAQTARIVWSESYTRAVDDTFAVLDDVGTSIVACIAHEIEARERSRAVLRPPESLDAWEAYHRGLWHMYRFNRADNEQARHFFEMAVRIDPTYARAYSGLSFTHFQNAFQGWADIRTETERAYATATESLMTDDRDPSARWAMGRAHWLRGQQPQALEELGVAVDLSPNFSVAHYALAFVHAQGGDAGSAITSADVARSLSPFDPMLFAFYASRALALVRLERLEEAAEWAVKAAGRPNAHAHIQALAALVLGAVGAREAAALHLKVLQQAAPRYHLGDFLRAFQLDPPSTRLFKRAAGEIKLGGE